MYPFSVSVRISQKLYVGLTVKVKYLVFCGTLWLYRLTQIFKFLTFIIFLYLPVAFDSFMCCMLCCVVYFCILILCPWFLLLGTFLTGAADISAKLLPVIIIVTVSQLVHTSFNFLNIIFSLPFTGLDYWTDIKFNTTSFYPLFIQSLPSVPLTLSCQCLVLLIKAYTANHRLVLVVY